MKITDSIVSIPPYISTAWENVASLSMEEDLLVFTMRDLTRVSVPHLSSQEVEQVFSAHAAFLEAHTPHELQKAPERDISFTPPFRMQLGNIEQFGQVMEHNPAHSGLPPIPEESLDRIAALSKIISEEEILAMPPPETNCNCMYCQVTRALRKAILQDVDMLPDHPQAQVEEKVEEEDLKFEAWAVELIGDKEYRVTNKLDALEQYTVSLQDPISCTCGKKNCEHLVAVLHT